MTCEQLEQMYLEYLLISTQSYVRNRVNSKAREHLSKKPASVMETTGYTTNRDIKTKWMDFSSEQSMQISWKGQFCLFDLHE